MLDERNSAAARWYASRTLESAPSMLGYWCSEGICRFANRAYERWFGAAPGGLLGRHLDEVLNAELRALYRQPIAAVLAGEPQTIERSIVDDQGQLRHALVRLTPDREQQRVVGFIVEVAEITELRRAEAEASRERAGRERAQSQAESLDHLLRERDEMLAVLSHEVRQPLHNAFAALQAATHALDAASAGERGEAAGVVPMALAKRVLREVTSNVDNTLAVASLLTGREPIVRLEQDIELLLQLAIADFPCDERTRFSVERQTATRTVSMDLGLMRLALRNLLANALRHGQDGSPVRIRLSDCDEPLALLIDVIDDGDGVESDMLPRLFERGARGRLGGQHERHGLGLFVARRALELHGGTALLADNRRGAVTLRLVLTPSPAD